jgi:hypothetical protein
MHLSHPARPAVLRALAPHGLVLLLAAAPLTLTACREQPVKEVEPASAAGAATAQNLPQMMESLLQRPDPALRRRVLERVQAMPSGEKVQLDGARMVAIGLTPDFWTTDGNPAAVVVRNDTGAPLAPRLQLATYSPGEIPVTVIDDGEQKREFRFPRTGVYPYDLPPVPPGETRLYIVDTDRTWEPGPPDTRKLGVQILPATPAAGTDAPAAAVATGAADTATR